MAPHPLGLACAAAMLGGAVACLFLPLLLPWPVYASCLLAGLAAWVRAWRARVLGAALLGFGWAGAQATLALAAQLPAAWEGREVALTGTVAGLPEHEVRRTRFQLRVDGDMPDPLRGRLLQLSWYDDFDASAPGPRMQLRPGARCPTRAGSTQAATRWRSASLPVAMCACRRWRANWLLPAGSTLGARGWPNGSKGRCRRRPRVSCARWRWAIRAGWKTSTGRRCARSG
jgi:predicted membrane metal-binding protein